MPALIFFTSSPLPLEKEHLASSHNARPNRFGKTKPAAYVNNESGSGMY